MSYSDPLPKRVRLLVLGGGIHGAGLLHDMASRGWQDVHLVEKSQIASGTSSRSTKLIHGGLRYLSHIRDFGLVFEALRERSTLLSVAPDLVEPLELYLPALKSGGMSPFMLSSGLRLYDMLAGKACIQKHKRVDPLEVAQKVPGLDQSLVKRVYSYWDMQTDDVALVRRVASSAKALGASITEGCTVRKVTPAANGWDVEVQDQEGAVRTISALYVFNALGPWSNRILEQSGIEPPYPGVNSKGAHLLVRDLGHKVGLFLQSPEDNRIFFVLPWKGHTLIGTTETVYNGSPDDLCVDARDTQYLLERCNRYLKTKLKERDIEASFAGLRWLVGARPDELGSISRNDVIGEQSSHKGLMFTLYGGKLTTYRKLSEQLGNRITEHFGETTPTRTHEPATWTDEYERRDDSPTAIVDRFRVGGLAN